MLMPTVADQWRVIAHLKKLGKREIEPLNSDNGICEELIQKFNLFICSMYPYFKHWKHYSGRTVFPIPYGNYDPGNAFFNMNIKKWDSKVYGSKRRDLCLFLADQLELELEASE